MADNGNGKGKRISLHPLSFDEAIAKLAQSKRKDSPADGSRNTKEPARESAPSKK